MPEQKLLDPPDRRGRQCGAYKGRSEKALFAFKCYEGALVPLFALHWNWRPLEGLCFLSVRMVVLLGKQSRVRPSIGVAFRGFPESPRTLPIRLERARCPLFRGVREEGGTG